ncbi:MAG: peptidylprolyl isomerase [Verrucomicrobia bacterium RIFCSPLOWO2_12_FULL_64_8]|nr:MAG: peptidylprolyl isomerase [Verrucomicrobia bacterium RIFCSPLOWO2_12_FULL_64_8]
MMYHSAAAGALLAFLAAVPAPYARSAAPTPPPADNLDLRYANGIAAIVEDRVITVEDIRRELRPHVGSIQQDSRNEQEFNQKLEALQDDIVQSLIDRVLIVKDFYKPKDGEKENTRQIPASVVDNQIAEIQITEFDGDRSKFLAYLRSRGLTLREYRREVTEGIINDYMRGQQHKSQSVVSPVKVETYYNENRDKFFQEDQASIRVIQLSRSNSETDAQLRAKADEVLAKFRAGESFAELATQYTDDITRRSKGGDQGWQKKSDLRREFAEVIFNMKKGQVSDPIIISEGCYLLYVEDRKYAGVQPIEEVRGDIERFLVQQMTRQSQERWLERLRRGGYVRIF